MKNGAIHEDERGEKRNFAMFRMDMTRYTAERLVRGIGSRSDPAPAFLGDRRRLVVVDGQVALVSGGYWGILTIHRFDLSTFRWQGWGAASPELWKIWSLDHARKPL